MILLHPVRKPEMAETFVAIQDSTKMAAASVEGFQQVQDIHDQVLCLLYLCLCATRFHEHCCHPEMT